MKFRIIAVSELDASLRSRWLDIRSQHRLLGSPFYAPTYTELIARHCDNVRIAVLEEDQRVIGFFPFQAEGSGRISNVGRFLSDYHGVIADPALDLDVSALLRACGGRYMSFDHMPREQKALSVHSRFRNASPVMCLEGGEAAYRQRLEDAHGGEKTNLFRDTAKRERRMEREYGPLRFTVDDDNREAFEILLQRKAEQFIRSFGPQGNKLAVPWVRDCVVDFFETRAADFRGLLSTMYAGDRLMASMLSLCSGSLAHGVMISYDTEASSLSPGLGFLVNFAKSADAHGFTHFDFGRGDSPYKMRMMTETVELGEGAVSRPAFVAQGILSAKTFKRWAKVQWQQRKATKA